VGAPVGGARGASDRELVARLPTSGQGLVALLPSRSAAAVAPEQC
jgi:hypothetical protein